MDSLVKAMQERAQKQVNLNEHMREVFAEAFKLGEKYEKDAAYQAYGWMAVDVAVSMFNMFQSAKHDKGVMGVMHTLTFSLNANKFWQNSAPVLVPLMQAALNAMTDSIFLQAERATNDAYQHDENLIIGARAMPLEIFPMIAFMLDGPQLMSECSLSLKRDLAPYFLS